MIFGINIRSEGNREVVATQSCLNLITSEVSDGQKWLNFWTSGGVRCSENQYIYYRKHMETHGHTQEHTDKLGHSHTKMDTHRHSWAHTDAQGHTWTHTDTK